MDRLPFARGQDLLAVAPRYRARHQQAPRRAGLDPGCGYRMAVPHEQLRVHADRITDEPTTLPVTW